jgi:hypothetical protein
MFLSYPGTGEERFWSIKWPGPISRSYAIEKSKIKNPAKHFQIRKVN